MKYLNALNKIKGVGAQKMKILLDFFEKGETIWQAPPEELSRSGIGDQLAEKIAAERKAIDPDREWENLEKNQVSMIVFTNPAYPTLLKEIPNPPYILYAKGDLSIFGEKVPPMIAIVGSRKFTNYGKQVAYSFAKDLAHAGILVVSGLALGIDSFAHIGALDGHGLTIAVLGSSLEDSMIGPRSNFKLAQNIMQSGALFSELPLDNPAGPGSFPARNRLMAGLTLGTIIIEAAEDSGSLITANLALEFNREVFAVPGSIFSPQSRGTNKLIKGGAKLATSVTDILEELRLKDKAIKQEIKKILPASQEEESILKILSHEPIHIDKIARHSTLETNVVSSTLTIMEMKGMIKNIGGQNYIKL